MTRCDIFAILAAGVWLPFPPAALRPNARAHQRTLSRARQQYRIDVEYALIAALGPRPYPQFAGRALLRLEAVWPSGRWWWDSDAIVSAFKPGRDAIVRLGLVRDDHHHYLRAAAPAYRIDRAARAPYLVLRLVADADADADAEVVDVEAKRDL